MSSGERVGRRDTEPAQPNLILLEGLFGQCPSPALHRLVPLLQAVGHIRVRDAYRSWDQSCDEVCVRSPPRSGGPYPTLDSAADDSGGVFGVIERSGFHENGEGPLHVESACLGISEGGKQWSVGGALTNLLEAVRIQP